MVTVGRPSGSKLLTLAAASVSPANYRGLLESIIFRAPTSPQSRQLITQAALKEPLFAAAHLAWDTEHAKRKS